MTRYEEDEEIATRAAMAQWHASLKRDDLSDEDRVRGAIEAYKRQWFTFQVIYDLSV